MLALINDQDDKHRITKEYVGGLESGFKMLITTPPNVTELQHVLARNLKKTKETSQNQAIRKAQELIQDFFKGYQIGIETSGDEQSTFDVWTANKSYDHKEEWIRTA